MSLIMQTITRVSAYDTKSNASYLKLAALSRILLEWFTQNFMQANAGRFQYILLEGLIVTANFTSKNQLHIRQQVAYGFSELM